MGRALRVAFFIIAVSFSMTFLQAVNFYYSEGYGYESVYHGEVESGTGSPFLRYLPTPLFGYEITTDDATVVDSTNKTQVEAALKDAAEYDPAPLGLSDTLGFFSWVVNGIKFIINGFFMPLSGVPSLLSDFYMPDFVGYPIGATLFILQILGIYEFASGREVLG